MDVTRRNYVKAFDGLLRMRLPTLLSWSYNEHEDVLMLTLPDPKRPDLSTIGKETGRG